MLKCKKLLAPGTLSLLLVLAQSPLYALDQAATAYTYNTQDQNNRPVDSVEKGHWIINDTSSGPDIPEMGRSLFDLIFSVDHSGVLKYQIPFPLRELIEKINNHMQSSDESIKRVRIPIGRSLRREAAAPDYFHSPRIVIAADAGPITTRGEAGINLKGRLFLGYQEKSNILEIISYNTQAGRFEFQEVHNYGAGLKPEVFYSNRVLCLSCHQNQGPIFSKEPWLETDSNQQIRDRMPGQTSTSNIKAKYLPRFDNVWALDYATDRANYFLSSQFIWQQGCQTNDKENDFEGIRCRGAMFLAILQYHLLDSVDQNRVSFRNWFMPIIERNWKQKWPGGLLIATADITDKSPFSATSLSTQDPLNPRPPRAKWLNPSTHLLTGIIYQTADFITQADIVQVDQFLKKQAKIKNFPVNRYQSNCSLKRTANVGSKQHLEFDCKQVDTFNAKEFVGTGSFIIENNRIIDGNIDSLIIPTQATRLRFLDLGEASIKTDAGLQRASIPVNKYESHIGARLIDGTLLRQIEFEWPLSLGEFDSVSNQPATLITVNDIEPLYTAIEKMIVDNETGQSNVLSSNPFQRHSLLKLLHQKLGMPALKWHQDKIKTRIASKNKFNTNEPIKEFLPFYRNCSSCHLTQGNYPPGFLNGSAREVKQQLTQCAKKILVRLSLWNNKPENRLISPMPPSSWLSSSGLTEADWLESDDLIKMQTIARTLLTNSSPMPNQVNQASSLCL